jgi:periplasmic protein CpxP/Spy
MKKTIIALAVVMLAGTAPSFAQGGGNGGFQMPTPEERVKRVHFKADSAFKLDEAKMKEMDAAYLDYYKAQDKVREEAMASAGGDRDAMRAAMQEKMKPFMEALDTKVKPILGDDKFKIWKEQIEPTLRGRGGPPRQ